MSEQDQNKEKIKSFNIAPAGPRHKTTKQRKLEEEKAAAIVYEEFVATFEEPATQGKSFVRGSVINPGSGEEKTTSQTGKLYMPPKSYDLPKTTRKETRPPPPPSKPEKPSKKKEAEKKKSNLQLFKEELKLRQEERDAKRVNAIIKGHHPLIVENDSTEHQMTSRDDSRFSGTGSHDVGDPNTTNIYLGNLNPKMNEQDLCELFGEFGSLASVKIMKPRTEEERSRSKNYGFVAYMSRKDVERGMKFLNGKDIEGYELKLGWAKSIPIPPIPMYIPPALLELLTPPPISGLPFNAQPGKNMGERDFRQVHLDEIEKILPNTLVKVVMPADNDILRLIHRTIEYVVREGPAFERFIMHQELNNPMYTFLFDHQSPLHIYYRWRLFSVLQGDSFTEWKTSDFRMFAGGSIWRPPVNILTGMPKSLIDRVESMKKVMKDENRDDLEDLLRNITPERSKIEEAMVYCYQIAEWSEEVVDCIAESLCMPDTPLYKLVARVYLISDILHNCSAKVSNASSYRKVFEAKLPEIFKALYLRFMSVDGRLRADQFKQRLMKCFQVWENWSIYSQDYLDNLQNIFLGLDVPKISKKEINLENVEDIDGIAIDDDIDGIPMDENLIQKDSVSQAPKFFPSKWLTVDPETVVSQAMTTSKWDILDQHDEQDIDGMPLEESLNNESVDKESYNNLTEMDKDKRRTKLREIEVRVLKFQDELESGRITRKYGMSISEEVEHYKNKLIRNIKTDESSSSKESSPNNDETSSRKSERSSRFNSENRTSRSSNRSSHKSDRGYYPNKRYRSRSRSPKRRSNHSRSGANRQRSRSPPKKYRN